MNTRNLPFIGALLVLIIAGAGVAYILTRPAPATAPTEPTATATSTTATTISHTSNDSGKYYDIKAVYPYQTPLAADANAKATATIKAWIDETIAQFKTDGNFANLTQEDITMQGLDQGRKYSLDIEYETHASGNTLSYVFKVYEDTLGAHPNAFYRTFTFESASGTELKIGDLFSSANYLNTLTAAVRPILKTQIAKAEQVSANEVDTSMLNAGTEPVADNFSWFYLEKGNLVLIFPPYQVGPWALGTQTVTLPVKSLSGSLKAQYAGN